LPTEFVLYLSSLRPVWVTSLIISLEDRFEWEVYELSILVESRDARIACKEEIKSVQEGLNNLFPANHGLIMIVVSLVGLEVAY